MTSARKLSDAYIQGLTGISTIDVGGISFGVTNLDNAVDWLIEGAAGSNQAVPVRLANAYCVALTTSDAKYHRLMTEHGINFPDGMPVAMLLRLFAKKNGHSSTQVGRVRGPSFFEAVVDRGRAEGLRHFFLGTTPDTLDKLTKQLSVQYPGTIVAGTYSPPFAPLDDAYVQKCTDQVNAADADIVWIGIGTPKQDFLATRLVKSTGKYCVGVGAAFDFSAKTAKEAPKWIQDSGFEWLYRLAAEPKRLWKRYVFGNLKFTGAVILNNIVRGR